MHPKRSVETKNEKRKTKHPTYPIKVIPGMYLLYMYPRVSGGQFNGQKGIQFLIRMGRGVLHTPPRVPGLRIISQEAI